MRRGGSDMGKLSGAKVGRLKETLQVQASREVATAREGYESRVSASHCFRNAFLCKFANYIGLGVHFRLLLRAVSALSY
jgi:hypothetical protein